jgi:hypothetical protein
MNIPATVPAAPTSSGIFNSLWLIVPTAWMDSSAHNIPDDRILYPGDYFTADGRPDRAAAVGPSYDLEF